MAFKNPIRLRLRSWKCTSCKSGVYTPGPVSVCSGCGSGRSTREGEKFIRSKKRVVITDIGLIRSYLHLDNEIEIIQVDDEFFALVRNGVELSHREIRKIIRYAADRICDYCTNDNPEGQENCYSCGAELAGAAKRQSRRIKTTLSAAGSKLKTAPGANTLRKARNATRAKLAKSKKVQWVKEAARVTEEATASSLRRSSQRIHQTAVRTRVPEWVIYTGLGLLVAVVLYLFWYFLLETEDYRAKVHDYDWERGVTLIQLSLETDSGSTVPPGAVVIETKTREITCPPESARTPSSTIETYGTGSGIAVDIRQEAPAVETPTCVPRTVTTYTYQYLEWSPYRTVPSSEPDRDPYWPEMNLKVAFWDSEREDACSHAKKKGNKGHFAVGDIRVSGCSTTFNVKFLTVGETSKFFRWSTSNEDQWNEVIEREVATIAGNRVGRVLGITLD